MRVAQIYGRAVPISEPSLAARLGRRLRAIVLVLVIIGSLFPSIAGVQPVLVSSVAALALIAFEILRHSPTIFKLILFIAILTAVLVLSGLYNPPTSDYGIEKFQRIYTLTLLTMMSVTLIRDRAGFETFLRIWVAASVILSGVAIFGGVSANGRAVGFNDVSNPIWQARAIGAAAVIAFWLMWERGWRLRFVLPLTVFLLVGMFATGSRGPLAATAVGVLVLALCATKHRRRRTFAMLAASAVTLALITLIPQFASSRIAEFVSGNADNVDAGARYAMWGKTLDVIANNPSGVGFGNWGSVTNFAPPYYWPHNVFLELFAEAGWISGAVFVALVLFVLIRLVRRSRQSAYAVVSLALLVSEIVNSSVSGDLSSRTLFAFLAIGFFVSTWPMSSHPSSQPATRRRANPVTMTRVNG